MKFLYQDRARLPGTTAEVCPGGPPLCPPPGPGATASGPGRSGALRPRDADLDPPRRHLGVLLLAHEVELGRADVAVSRELPHLVQRGAVADGVVDGGLPQAMD